MSSVSRSPRPVSEKVLSLTPGFHRKFGKYIARQQLDIPEYAASLVNYKALKRLIRSLAASRATPTTQEASSGISNAPGTQTHDPQVTLQANKATFFFRLERELEKVNAFYLQKEAELKLRLRTLLDKKKAMQSQSSGTSNKVSATFITLQEGFLLFHVDLNKFQQFVDLNATAFSKILKKWDKSSKSRTKELYLSRAVEVQPCFNRDVITELSDLAITSSLELEAWVEGDNIVFDQKPTERAAGENDEPDTDAEISKAVISDNTSILQEWISCLQASPDAGDRITKVFLAAIPGASDRSLEILGLSGVIDWRAKDEINKRNCLHEAAIAGKYSVLELGLTGGADPNETDVYGRNPLHYACMHGHLDMIKSLVKGASTAALNTMDHDNYTPLIHAINNNQPMTVQLLITSGARVDANGEQDYIPLNLSCQNGLVEVTEILLQQRPRIQVDAEGLYPQHHVARSGHSTRLLLMLKEYGADIDEVDKLNQWTPVFHAASEGHVGCLKVLLDWGARVDILDENGLSAMYYAAWEGHLECIQILSTFHSGLGIMGTEALRSTPSPTPTDNIMAIDSDGIPDLSLPPPIIPLRRYGHNFLDKKTLVQLILQEPGSKAILFFHESRYPVARLTISSKSIDIIPRNIMLPLTDDSKSLAFQVDGIEPFMLDFDIFPTFGSKSMARTVALPNTFTALDAGHCTLPLFDPRLRAIGKLSFDYQIIKPFQGVPLDIAHFATYWKATTKFDSHSGALITGSSLSGEYVRLFVQLTCDLVPVLFPHSFIKVADIDVPISSITAAQFDSIGIQYGSYQQRQRLAGTQSHAEAFGLLGSSFLTLEEALKLLPVKIHVDLNIAYPNYEEAGNVRAFPRSQLNTSVDSILAVIFESARTLRELSPENARLMMFSSYNMNICTALNWKQPNYPVLYCNDLGNELIPEPIGTGSTSRCRVSIREAVSLASNNNLMGIICSSKLLTLIPTLIQSIKEAGLVVVAHTSDDSIFRQAGVDGILRKEGVLKFEETIGS